MKHFVQVGRSLVYCFEEGGLTRLRFRKCDLDTLKEGIYDTVFTIDATGNDKLEERFWAGYMLENETSSEPDRYRVAIETKKPEHVWLYIEGAAFFEHSERNLNNSWDTLCLGEVKPELNESGVNKSILQIGVPAGRRSELYICYDPDCNKVR